LAGAWLWANLVARNTLGGTDARRLPSSEGGRNAPRAETTGFWATGLNSANNAAPQLCRVLLVRHQPPALGKGSLDYRITQGPTRAAYSTPKTRSQANIHQGRGACRPPPYSGQAGLDRRKPCVDLSRFLVFLSFLLKQQLWLYPVAHFSRWPFGRGTSLVIQVTLSQILYTFVIFLF
jgi:hypothetical protein